MPDFLRFINEVLAMTGKQKGFVTFLVGKILILHAMDFYL